MIINKHNDYPVFGFMENINDNNLTPFFMESYLKDKGFELTKEYHLLIIESEKYLQGFVIPYEVFPELNLTKEFASKWVKEQIKEDKMPLYDYNIDIKKYK